jgi:hypothetical protein
VVASGLAPEELRPLFPTEPAEHNPEMQRRNVSRNTVSGNEDFPVSGLRAGETDVFP